MSDPLRTDDSSALEPASDAEREAKIERLLLSGLDHYFSGEYEQAIDVWSRAFFLDRTHARARAYIERARTALAERQRESEELLQYGVAAFQRGDGEEARRFLRAALTRGAPSDEALAVLDRINRLEQGTSRSLVSESDGRGTVAPAMATGQPVSTPIRVALALAVVMVAALVGVAELRWSWFTDSLSGSSSLSPLSSVSDASLPLPRRGETALTRAHELMSNGRLRDALAELELVRPTDPERATADQLRGDIQKQLIAIATGSRLAPEPLTRAKLP
jgi:tetratricopeptide (TPR) repeat protein